MNDATGEFMLMTLDKDNYPTVKLFVNGKDNVYKVHRLCCNAFKSNPFKLPEVDHLNRNHWDNSKENLEFVTGSENLKRLHKLREIEKAQLCNYNKVAYNRTKYTESQILQVCLRLCNKENISSISDKTCVDVRTIYLIKSGKIWKNISCYFSFNNDGLFDNKTLREIYYYFDNKFTNKAILNILGIQFDNYFDEILNKIRITYKNLNED